MVKKKAEKKQCWCKGYCNNWCETYKFYGIKGYTFNTCWDNVRNNGILSQYKFETNMIKKALKSGKLTHTRLVGESLGWLFIGICIGYSVVCLFGKVICWIF